MTGDYSAGVLIYYIDENGNISFLLGKDRRNKWSDFGGKSEESDYNDIKNTAAREFYEESIGVIMNKYTVRYILNHCSYVVGKSYLNKNYYMFLVRTYKKNKYIEDFREHYKFIKNCFGNSSHYCEKVEVQWMDFDQISSNAFGEIRQVFHNTFMTNKSKIDSLIMRKYHAT
jgi:hypothetical protein